MIDFHDVKYEIGFTYVDSDNKVTMIAVERLLKDPYVRSTPVTQILLNKENVDHVFKNGGLEPHRLSRITEEDLVRYPVHFLDWGDGCQVLVDGNHRVAYAGLIGKRFIGGRIVDPEHWRPYIVTGLPDVYANTDLLKRGLREGFSGIR